MKKERNRKYYLDDRQYNGFIVSLLFYSFLIIITCLYFLICEESNDAAYLMNKSRYREKTAELLKEYDSPETVFVKETADLFRTKHALYDNSQVLSCVLSGSEAFCIGGGTERLSDGLYLRPRVIPSPGFENHTYAVYAECNTNGLSYPKKTERIEEGETYILLGRTFDRIGAGDGLRWNHDTVAENSTFGDTEFRFRIIDLSMNRIAGTVSCGVIWDGERFAFTNLRSTDIGNGREFTEEQRKEFIITAVSFLKDKRTGILRFSGSEYDNKFYEKYAVVQKTDRPYFKIMADREGKYIRASTIKYLHPVAVSLYTEIGAVTVYLASCEEYGESNMRKNGYGDPGNNPCGYFAFGYDLLNPVSEDALVVPPTFKKVRDELQLEGIYQE